MLPSLPYMDKYRKGVQLQFGGLDHRRGAGEGTLWDMENLTAQEAPLISSRDPRHFVRTLEKPNGMWAADDLIWVDGTNLYVNGELRWSELTDTPKIFASLGNYTCVLPDKIVVRKDLPLSIQYMEHSLTNDAIFTDGTLYGEPAEKNALFIPYEAQQVWYGFNIGDAVKIETQVEIAGELTWIEYKTAIIRDISYNRQALFFSENTFNAVTTTPQPVRVTRAVPDMDFMCVNENRLWGCKGDTIYASKLGDPTNWNVFDGISTDSYAVDVGTEGSFTGCCSYLGYPIFFKENHVYKIYGDKPSNFHVMQSADLGVESGSGKSLAVAGEVLYYLSRAGVMAYAGGVPENISAVFGLMNFQDAVAGSDGVRYAVSMTDGDGNRHLMIYDTRYGMWHREDDFDAIDFCWHQSGLWALDRDGGMWYLWGDDVPEGATEEENIESFAEFGDWAEGAPQRKGSSHVELRVELEAGSLLEVSVQYDSDGVWRPVGRMEATQKRSFYLPVIPRRCDHWRLRLEGVGKWRLYSLTRNFYIGSSFH